MFFGVLLVPFLILSSYLLASGGLNVFLPYLLFINTSKSYVGVLRVAINKDKIKIESYPHFVGWKG